MDRYADMLEIKRANLEGVRVELEAKRTKLGREIEDLKQEITENLNQGKAAITQGQNQIASLAGTKVATDQGTLKQYIPIYDKMTANCEFLSELSDNWKYSIEKLRYTIDRKREEYENLKEMAGALNQADEFTNGNTEASKVYKESIKQLEITTSSYIARIDDFEKNSKDILGNIRVERQAVQDEGLATIEEYAKSGQLMLPDFSNMLNADNAAPAAADAGSDGAKKFKL
jgi:chromosome segregation ATPase